MPSGDTCFTSHSSSGQSPEAFCDRLVKEETGFDVRLVKKLTVLKNPFPGTKETHVYLGKIIRGKLRFSQKEILDLRWFTEEEIVGMSDKLTGPWLPEVIKLLK